MVGNIIASLVFVIIAIVFTVFNKQLANRFAEKFMMILPSSLRQERFFVICYRVLFYFFSFFCTVAVLLFIGSLLFNK